MRANAGCRSVLEAVRMFRLWGPTASLTDFMSLLYVCENEGVSVKELAYLGGTSAATMSRSIKYLAGYSECDLAAEYLCLLRLCSHPCDGRRRAVFLTEDGRQLKRDIEALFSASTAASGDLTT